ncbi:hypothetical protein WICPIJ_009441 [Wickerhamomyces pijperi]|uniref:CBM1 domain-containing protein n=1 Tax=Wickerhamomyces pijperi TaxID=599730 RepID=A0A9P8TDZ9_WICPI|nr:hypothetical protein WICPIJ_009441 [Wickerhamomyces pijperi]
MVNIVTLIALAGSLALAHDNDDKHHDDKHHDDKHHDDKHHDDKTHHTKDHTSFIFPNATSSIPTTSSTFSISTTTSSQSPSFTEVPAFGQCGGQSYHGATNCALGYECVYQNDWYSQCTAINYPSNEYAQRWEQCHGVNYNGPTDCVPGFTCAIDNKYYGGCQPGTASSLLTTSSSSTSSSTSHTSATTATAKAPLFGQCGGINYNGPTECADGAVCKRYGSWYSQCIFDFF